MEPKTLNFFRKELELLNLPKDAIEDILKSIQEHYSKISLPIGQAQLPEIIKVYKEEQKASSTDISLLVATPTKGTLIPWNRERITEALIKEARLFKEEAEDIAQSVERKIFITDLKTVSTGLIRALVDNELLLRGLTKKLTKQKILGMPTYDVSQLIYSKTLENSNIAANNPEAINLAIAETVIKQYLLQNVFSEEVAEAHLKGVFHIHDMGYPRVYCSAHSLEYIKKYGLRLENLASTSKPATYASTLTGHLNTFLASMQAYYAGALGIGYINILYAPYLVGLSQKELKQIAQYLIFSASQNAFSRGGQSLFLDYNLHLGVPSYLKDIPAIGPKGMYMIKHKNGQIERVDEVPRDKKGDPIDPKNAHILRYGDFEKEAQAFVKAMMEVWEEGDADGQPFAFPKMDLHINAETFSDPKQYKLFQYACQIASKNGAPYFVFDRDEVNLAMCCRLRTKVTDQYMIKHPESLRFCGFQNVTINLPQAAYRTQRNGERTVDGVIKEIRKAMDIAMKAHFQKKRFIERTSAEPGLPMWQVGKKALDGRPYIDFDKATYIIGILGLNECVKAICGHHLHDQSEEAYKIGLEIISAMYLKAKELKKETGLKVTLEETPAESASLRLAKVDLIEYPESKNYIRGNQKTGQVYYTNSIHYVSDAPIDIIQRIEGQARFNPLIESGAITHCFVGEKLPSAKSIENLVKKTWENTQSAQIVISPEFTVCQDCHSVYPGYDR